MDMSFQEKSAWGSLAILALVAYWFFPSAFAAAAVTDDPVDLFVLTIGCLVTLGIFEVVYHTIIAARGGTQRDERDQLIRMRAERNAGFVLWTVLFWLVGHIVLSAKFADREHSLPFAGMEPLSSLEIAVWILFALTASELGKLASQVWYYRVET